MTSTMLVQTSLLHALRLGWAAIDLLDPSLLMVEG
jgi:hypothetical protein